MFYFLNLKLKLCLLKARISLQAAEEPSTLRTSSVFVQLCDLWPPDQESLCQSDRCLSICETHWSAAPAELHPADPDRTTVFVSSWITRIFRPKQTIVVSLRLKLGFYYPDKPWRWCWSLQQWSPTFNAPRAGLMPDNIVTDGSPHINAERLGVTENPYF